MLPMFENPSRTCQVVAGATSLWCRLLLVAALAAGVLLAATSDDGRALVAGGLVAAFALAGVALYRKPLRPGR
jgi:uncharacterized membrane protein